MIYYFCKFFIAYVFKGQVHVFAGQQEKYNIEIFLCPEKCSNN